VIARVLLVLVVAVGCGRTQRAPNAPATPSRPALYDRLGRMDAIKDIAKAFVEQQLVNGPLSARFASVDVARLQDQLAIQLCELSGGPCTYTGRSMRDVHAGMAISDAELSTFLAGLRTTLDRFQIDAKAQEELLALVRDQYGAPPELPPGP
jgi:hemoglobin